MNKKYFFSILVFVAFAITSCQKKVEPVDVSNVTVELLGGAKRVTSNITVNPKDSLYFDFTITSSQEMGFVSIQKNPVNQTAFLVRDTMSSTTKYSYAALKRLMADSANGSYIYRIVAHTAKGIYIGHKDVIVTVNPDFYYYPSRVLYAPDSVLKVNKNLVSAQNGTIFSYAEGGSNSSKIDFGYFYDTSKTGTTVNGHTIYALSSTGISSVFNFSTWTKNATIFKKLTSGTPNPTFAQALSAGTLRTAGATQLASGTTAKVFGLSTTSPHNTVYFKTASGKFGMLQVNFTSVFTNATGGVDPTNTFISVDVKIEK